MDNRNRFIIGLQYDEAKRSLKDVDYYWFHDMHCSQFIVRYRAKRASWQFRLEFTPW
jgi:LPS-assembly protein